MQEFQSIIYGGTNLGVVQQVERGIWDAGVGGSSPFIQTKSEGNGSIVLQTSRVDIAEFVGLNPTHLTKGI